jgi:transcriptional regulator GlxA family with amidase domain
MKAAMPDYANASAVIHVTIVLIEGSFASTSIGPMEVFHSAGTLWNTMTGETAAPRFQVRIASIDGGSVNSMCSLGMMPECAIDEIERTDIILLPASGLDVQDHIARSTQLLPWLHKWHGRGAYIAGICTGVAYLAESGLLDGRQATTHWAVAETLRQRYPKVLWRTEHFVTEDGQMFCSGGVYAAIDLSLYMVEKFCGHEIALKCAKSLLLSMPRSSQSGYALVPISAPHSDHKIREIEEFMRSVLDREVSAEYLAERIGMGARSFVRRFKRATGHAPGAYMQLLKIASARDMLEKDNASVAVVSSRVGYSDLAFFRRLFKRHTGLTPSEYRDRFGRMAYDR